MYVFDTSPLIVLFGHFYPDHFPSLWKNFDVLKDEGKIISVREVGNELKNYSGTPRQGDWAMQNSGFFATPSHEELLFVAKIFEKQHFQTLIRKKELLKGKPVADPFVIAKAAVSGGCVITQERKKDNSSHIPNVCEHFGIPCINLEEFMKRENWKF